MTTEQKYLLLKDLCSRLPYFTKVQIKNEIVVLDSICDDDGYHFNFIGEDREGVNIEEIKPWLYPLSSMTEEQIMQSPNSIHICDLENLRYDYIWTELNSRLTDLIDLIGWLNKHHFDYRGLIEKGLAIDATGKNIY